MAGPPQPKAPTGFRAKRRSTRTVEFDRAFSLGKEAVKRRSRGWCEVRGCDRRAAHTHHKGGRRGPVDVVNDPAMLLHVCAECDLRITTEPAWAKREGYSVDRVPLPSEKSVLRPEARAYAAADQRERRESV